LQDEINNINPSQSSNAGIYVKKILELGQKINEVINSVQLANAQMQAPNSELEAEMKRLQEEDPEFRDLINQITRLNEQKEAFAVELATTIQEVANITSHIADNLFALDVANRQLDSQEYFVKPDTLRA